MNRAVMTLKEVFDKWVRQGDFEEFLEDLCFSCSSYSIICECNREIDVCNLCAVQEEGARIKNQGGE